MIYILNKKTQKDEKLVFQKKLQTYIKHIKQNNDHVRIMRKIALLKNSIKVKIFLSQNVSKLPDIRQRNKRMCVTNT